MKRQSAIYILLLFFSLFSLLFSCVSAPKILEPSIRLSVASIDELKAKFGYTYKTNPYLEPVSSFAGKKNEFVVLRIELNLIKASRLVAKATIVSSDRGKELARVYDMERFKLYWDMQAEGPKDSIRESNIQRSYLPWLSFNAKSGSSIYYLVLVGPNPIDRPAKLSAQLFVEGLNPQVLDIDLPQ